jgi:60 kDa SS-A/Ro ribonucleoprotein
MLSNFCQVIRSGVIGRQSFGRRPRRLIRQWLNNQDPVDLWSQCLGGEPSLIDIIKMVHPKFDSPTAQNVVAYLLGREYMVRALPDEIRAYEKFKAGSTEDLISGIPFLRLTSLPLKVNHWKDMIPDMGYQALRINLNTLIRQGALGDANAVRFVASRLADRDSILRSNTMPYQLLAAYKNFKADDIVGGIAIQNALQDAMEIATENTPSFDGANIAVCCDVSGSMKLPITGNIGNVSSKIRCVDVAALFTACLMRKNSEAVVLPFDTRTHKANLNPRDSIMTNANKLAAYGGGGTYCEQALKELLNTGALSDIVIFISDNESWGHSAWGRENDTLLQVWAQYKKKNRKAKLVLIDIQPSTTTSARTGPDVLNIGGFSDNIWDAISNFIYGNDSLITSIENVTL